MSRMSDERHVTRSVRSTPVGLAARIEQWREEGRRQERERIIEWLVSVGDSVASPTEADEITPDQQRGALGIIRVLIEKLKES